MLCVICSVNPASDYVKKSDGKEIRLCLCSECYQKLYGEKRSDFFTSFVGAVAPSPKRTRTCPECGASFDDFHRTGLVGCAYCYTVFRNELMPTVRFVQGKTEHAGARPKDEAAGKYALIREQEELKSALEKAIREGDYASADYYTVRLKRVNKAIYSGEKS